MAFDFISIDKIQDLAQHYGYWAVFLGILLENIGIPLPGETVTLVGGFLAGNEQLSYWWVLGNAALGATIGGTIGYWVGRYGGWPLLVRAGGLFRVQETQLRSLREQFSQNAGKTVFVGRFVALLRIFASPLAGIVEMPYAQFMVYNTLGALAWASVMVTLSYFAGQFISLEQLVSLTSRFAVVTLLLVIASIVVPLWLESRKAKVETATAESTEGQTEDSLTSH